MARRTNDPRAQPRCDWSILIRVGSFCVALPQNLAEEGARIDAVRGVVRARVDATRFFQVRAEVAGGRFLLDDGFLTAGVFGVVGEHFERMEIDVAVGAVASAEAAADAPILDDYFEGIAAADGADGTADHAKRIAALSAGGGNEIVFEPQAVAHQARHTVVRVGAGVHTSVATGAVFQIEYQQALRFHQALREELVEGDPLHHLQAVLIGGAAFRGNLLQTSSDVRKALNHLAEIVAGYFHDFDVIEGRAGCRARAAAEEADFAEVVTSGEIRQDE